jgi:uncharacterized protein YndB with AHSA1/START domain
MSTKTKASSKNKKATSKKVVKKVAAKKPVAKKKVVKPAAKAKPVKKSAVKPKVAAKKAVAKKPVKKVAPKKVAKPVKKVVAKKAVKKVVAKKIVKKFAPKKAVKPAKKVVAKKVAPKKAVKPVKKAAPVKVAVAKPVKVVVVKAPVVKAEKPAKVKKEKAPVIKKPIVAPTTFRKPENEVPTKFVKEPAGKFEMEFVIRASEDMVFEFVSTESGLSEWFCDDVNIRDGVFTFNWDGQIQQAKLIKEIPPISIRYQWLDKNDGSYFEFKTQKDELTNDISLIITDFASDKADEESARLLWHSQVDKLLHVLGSFF